MTEPLEAGEQPDQLSLVNANVAVPVNPSIAADVLPDGSVPRESPSPTASP